MCPLDEMAAESLGIPRLNKAECGMPNRFTQCCLAETSLLHAADFADAGAFATEGRVADLGPALFGQSEQPLHDSGVLHGNVLPFGNVTPHVVKFRFKHGLFQILTRPAIHAGLMAAKRAIYVRYDQFPLSRPHGFELGAAP